MTEIKLGQELVVENLYSIRSKMAQSELQSLGKKAEEIVKSFGATPKGSPITATFAMEGDKIDVELLFPIDKEIPAKDGFVFKKMLKITNAAVAGYKGHPSGFQSACNDLNQYISEHQLQPITVGYNVTKKTDMLNLENTEIEVYVGINPNIL